MTRKAKASANGDGDYVALGMRTDPRHCFVDQLSDLQLASDLSQALPLADDFPKGFKVDLSPDGGDLVPDVVANAYDILIVSEKAKRVLEREGVGEGDVEYLPIVLRDKRRKAFKEAFFIVNLLTTVDCFDWERSTYKTYDKKPRKLMTVKVLHVRPEAIPEDAKVFRLGELLNEVILRADLLEHLEKEGCQGPCVLPMGQKRIL